MPCQLYTLPTFDFNPRSPRGERRFSGRCWADWCDFNPRSREGSDRPAAYPGSKTGISIHAPREGSDKPLSGHDFFRLQHFNPRSPRGERLQRQNATCFGFLFQSTLPARGATLSCAQKRKIGIISIHAPREGSDFVTNAQEAAERHFNPRSPRGERLASEQTL